MCLFLLSLQAALAQDTGQVCVQSFEDRDGDGLRDPDERAIAQGIAAGLRNMAGVTIASLLLEDSPFAADGLLCFDQLLAGDYQIALRSAEFSNTTAASFRLRSPAPRQSRDLALPAAVGRRAASAASDRCRAPLLMPVAALSARDRILSMTHGSAVYFAVFRRRSSSMMTPLRPGPN